MLLSAVLAGCSMDQALGFSEKPNVILIVADDLRADDLEYMPETKALIGGEGVTFENAFVTDPLCCPSRATMLRGQYTHNHGVEGNVPPQGGFQRFRDLGREESTVATWLDAEGYSTAYFGKYMNSYRGTHVPPGWDEWYAVSGNYESNRYNDNGRIERHDPEQVHETDLLSDKANEHLRRTMEEDGSPFFAYLSPRAPHAPANPAARHEDAFSGVSLPRPPSFDEEDVSDKPAWLQERPRLEAGEVEEMEELYRQRLRSLLSVDEMVGRLVETLREGGELEDTYIAFTSDNGHHLGEHRLPAGKWTAYEEDIRVPLVMRGPGVPEGEAREHLVLNTDLAPTFAELAGASAQTPVDGRSLSPLLGDAPPPASGWRSAFMVEAGPFFEGAGAGEPLDRPRLEAVRTQDRLYVEYATGDRELYDLREDPYQLESQHEEADPGLLRRMEERLDALRGCAGEDCRSAEDGR